MQKTLKEIARLIEGEVVGNDQVEIKGVCGIKEASEGDITFLANPKYLPFIDKTKASAIITSYDVQSASKPIIRTKNPSFAFIKVVSLFVPSSTHHPKGIHPTAIIGKNVTLGKDVAVGAYTVIEDNVSIGDRTIL